MSINETKVNRYYIRIDFKEKVSSSFIEEKFHEFVESLEKDWIETQITIKKRELK